MSCAINQPFAIAAGCWAEGRSISGGLRDHFACHSIVHTYLILRHGCVVGPGTVSLRVPNIARVIAESALKHSQVRRFFYKSCSGTTINMIQPDFVHTTSLFGSYHVLAIGYPFRRLVSIAISFSDLFFLF